MKTKADITEDIILIIYMTTFVITNIIMTVVVLQENITDLRLMELMELLEHLKLLEHLELINLLISYYPAFFYVNENIVLIVLNELKFNPV